MKTLSTLAVNTSAINYTNYEQYAESVNAVINDALDNGVLVEQVQRELMNHFSTTVINASIRLSDSDLLESLEVTVKNEPEATALLDLGKIETMVKARTGQEQRRLTPKAFEVFTRKTGDPKIELLSLSLLTGQIDDEGIKTLKRYHGDLTLQLMNVLSGGALYPLCQDDIDSVYQ